MPQCRTVCVPASKRTRTCPDEQQKAGPSQRHNTSRQGKTIQGCQLIRHMVALIQNQQQAATARTQPASRWAQVKKMAYKSRGTRYRYRQTDRRTDRSPARVKGRPATRQPCGFYLSPARARRGLCLRIRCARAKNCEASCSWRRSSPALTANTRHECIVVREGRGSNTRSSSSAAAARDQSLRQHQSHRLPTTTPRSRPKLN